jgi:hypothetical protein
MSVSSIELERRLQERTRAGAAKQTTVTKLPKGQRRVPKVGTDGQPATTLPHPARVKAEAVAHAANKAALDSALLGKKPTKATRKPIKNQLKDQQKARVEGSPKASNRLTNTWPDAKGKDIAIGDTVTAADGHVINVIGRWSKHLKDGGLVPMVTGHVVSGGTKDKGARHNAVAAEATHVAKIVRGSGHPQ